MPRRHPTPSFTRIVPPHRATNLRKDLQKLEEFLTDDSASLGLRAFTEVIAVLHRYPSPKQCNLPTHTGEVKLAFRSLTIIRETLSNFTRAPSHLDEISDILRSNYQTIHDWWRSLTELQITEPGRLWDGLSASTIQHLALTLMLSIMPFVGTVLSVQPSFYREVALTSWSMDLLKSGEFRFIPDSNYSPGCTTVRLMDICIEHPVGRRELSAHLVGDDINRHHALSCAADRLRDIPGRVTIRGQVLGALYDISVIINLFSLLPSAESRWTYIIRSKVVHHLFAALFHLTTIRNITPIEVLSIGKESHSAIQWLVSNPAAIAKTIRQAVKAGALSIVASTFRALNPSSVHSTSTPYIFALDDFLVLAAHISYRPVLKVMGAALRRLPGTVFDPLWNVVRSWVEVAVEVGHTCSLNAERGFPYICNNPNHFELRGQHLRKGCRIRTCAHCHTAVYCSTKCQRADWEGLHHAECAHAAVEYQNSKAKGSHISYETRLHHRSLLEDLATRHHPSYPRPYGTHDAIPLLKLDSLHRGGHFEEFDQAKKFPTIPDYLKGRLDSYLALFERDRQGSLVTTEFHLGLERIEVVGYLEYVEESQTVILLDSFHYCVARVEGEEPEFGIRKWGRELMFYDPKYCP